MQRRAAVLELCRRLLKHRGQRAETLGTHGAKLGDFTFHRRAPFTHSASRSTEAWKKRGTLDKNWRWECGGCLGVRWQSEARAPTPPWRCVCRGGNACACRKSLPKAAWRCRFPPHSKAPPAFPRCRIQHRIRYQRNRRGGTFSTHACPLILSPPIPFCFGSRSPRHSTQRPRMWRRPMRGNRSARISRMRICLGTRRSRWSFRRIIRTGASAASW